MAFSCEPDPWSCLCVEGTRLTKREYLKEIDHKAESFITSNLDFVKRINGKSAYVWDTGHAFYCRGQSVS